MKLISYATKPGRADENRSRIEAVFAALNESKPDNLSYFVVQTGEGEFFHVVDATPEALDALQAMPAFREFSGTVADRQAAPSSRRDAVLVGSYGAAIRQ